MGIKERRTKILIGLFLLTDYDSINPASPAYMSFSEMTQNLLDLSMNQKTKSTLASLVREGSVELKSDTNEYRLTTKGFEELCMYFPYFRFIRNSWDKKWRILSYEIPEKKRDLRDRLRREVAGWGLGPWHRSFWLTPHPIIDSLRELVHGKEEEGFIQVFEADHTFGDREVLIEKVWGKTELDKKYRELFKVWHDILSKDEEKIHKLKQVIRQYVDLLRIDPGLPRELLGENWIGFEAFNIFKEIRTILLS